MIYSTWQMGSIVGMYQRSVMISYYKDDLVILKLYIVLLACVHILEHCKLG